MYLSDLVCDDYKRWQPGNTIVIHAQTGAGKTYFVLNVLLPFVKEQNKKLLYLSNRSALRDQVKLSYDPQFDDYIYAMNYQSFERLDLSRKTPSEKGENVLNCEYWVMDEAHYFLADGSFNSDVLACLRHIKSEQKNRILIFMTATPEYLFLSLGQARLLSKEPPTFKFDAGGNYLNLSYMCRGYLDDANLVYQLSSYANLSKYKEATDKDRQNYDMYLAAKEAYKSHPGEWFYEDQLPYSNNVSPDHFQRKLGEYTCFFENAKREIIYYQSTSEYANVCPVYFKSIEQLCAGIRKTPEKEKWLIFVSSKKRGEEIKASLQDAGIKSIMITAETKRHKAKRGRKQPEDYVVYQSIIKEEKSPVRVTISTAVLDNGVNLKDSCLKHIVILEMNPTSFIQMLGRKRFVHPEERVKLYLQKKDIGEIKGYFQRAILQYVKFIAELKLVNSEMDSATEACNLTIIENVKNFEREYQVNGTFRSPYCNYVQQSSTAPWGKDRDGNYLYSYICRLYEPNRNMTVRLVYDYYRMLALLESYENTPDEEKKAKKETLWIEHQLSWLGLEYDCTCWIDYGQHIAAKKKINRILKYGQGKFLSKKGQKRLKRAVICAVNTSHPPMTVTIGKGSLKKVNDALAEWGYSQRIKSKNKSINGRQRNYWFITDCNEELK